MTLEHMGLCFGEAEKRVKGVFSEVVGNLNPFRRLRVSVAQKRAQAIARIAKALREPPLALSREINLVVLGSSRRDALDSLIEHARMFIRLCSLCDEDVKLIDLLLAELQRKLGPTVTNRLGCESFWRELARPAFYSNILGACIHLMLPQAYRSEARARLLARAKYLFDAA
ncbi:MAG TPA: hypothetical protein VMX18_01200 [Candidatus Bipolaricaulota bacterium]|nr:hypothetical protein [Candidatus Bipolaricaulota bacterium]